jgi:hypothetical protein
MSGMLYSGFFNFTFPPPPKKTGSFNQTGKNGEIFEVLMVVNINIFWDVRHVGYVCLLQGGRGTLLPENRDKSSPTLHVANAPRQVTNSQDITYKTCHMLFLILYNTHVA